ncbi:hypothetical protein AALP_AA2G137100 [Arabis alpina]|uniref:Uncharacterized protein n=1 Tax=Arabis alpina TaxID=50452 RepID=A0A087HH88_ARAAL|nr:hypothetical protein AALP_AA2G137100 [Arabis alpina]
MKNQMNDIIETMERLGDRLERIEAKVDLLATKVDGGSGGRSSSNFSDGGSRGSSPAYTPPWYFRDGGSSSRRSRWPTYFPDGGSGDPLSSNVRDGGNGSPSSYVRDGGNGGIFGGGGDEQTIIVKGFDSWLPDDIKSQFVSLY